MPPVSTERKGPQKWSLKRETECFTAPGAVGGGAVGGGGGGGGDDVGLARVLSNCHFSQSVSEGTMKGRGGEGGEKRVQIETF